MTTISPSNEAQRSSDELQRLRSALENIADWRNVNISGEYEHGLRDIIRSIVDCAVAALDSPTQRPAPQAVLDSIPPHLNYLIGRGKTRPDEPLYGVQILDGLKIVAQTENDDLIAAIREAVSSLSRPNREPGQ